MSFSFVLLLSSNTDLVSRELIKRPLHLRTARSAHSIVHSFFWSFFLHCFSAFSILTQELFQAFATSIEREFVFCYRISSSSAKRTLFTETIFPDLLYCFSNDSSFSYLPFYVCFNLSHGYRKKKFDFIGNSKFFEDFNCRLNFKIFQILNTFEFQKI